MFYSYLILCFHTNFEIIINTILNFFRNSGSTNNNKVRNTDFDRFRYCML